MENSKNKNDNIERALLGLIIRKPNLIATTMGILNPSHFSNENFELFGLIENLFNKKQKIDEKILIENIKKTSVKDTKFWVEYFANLKIDSGVQVNIKEYINIILEKKQKENLKNALQSSVKLIDNDDFENQTFNLIQEIESNIFNVTKTRELKDFEPISSLVSNFTSKLEKIKVEGYKEGLLTEMNSLDFLIGGFKKGELIVIAGRPSMGKTAFALQIVNNISSKKNVGFFSLEMPSSSIIQRFVSINAMVNQDFIRNYDILTDKDIEKVQISLEKINNKKIWIDDTPGITMGELAWKMRKLHSLVNLDIIIVDYLQLLEISGKIENRQQSISEISRTLKSLARELEIPVIALSQLSRKVESREIKRPLMSDLRESGAIEQDADVILLLYRAKYYNKDEQQQSPIEDFEVIVSKNRNGKTGNVILDINMEYGKITSKRVV